MQNVSLSSAMPRDTSPRYFPLGATAFNAASTPDISTPPGNGPTHFPERQPMSDDGLEGAKKDASVSMKSGGGEDPFVESGVPENDPERPRETPEEQSNR